MNKPIIELKGISKSYKETLAVNNISFSVSEGEVVALAGPNGAGKSTLLSIITRASVPDKGEVLFKGVPVNECKKEYSSKLGFVPQEVAVYDELSVEANLSFFTKISGVAPKAVTQNMRYALGITCMEPYVKKRVSELSGGMKHRLNIACGIVNMPELLIMDEPTTGIDSQSRQSIYDAVRRLNENGQTLLIATHDADAMQNLCTRMIYIKNGSVFIDIQVCDIIKQCEDRFVIEITAENLPDTDIPGCAIASKEKNRMMLITDAGTRDAVLKELGRMPLQSVFWRRMDVADYLKQAGEESAYAE